MSPIRSCPKRACEGMPRIDIIGRLLLPRLRGRRIRPRGKHPGARADRGRAAVGARVALRVLQAPPPLPSPAGGGGGQEGSSARSPLPLLHQRALALRQRPERLLGRDRRELLVEIVLALRF